jgi:dolichyl-phosphate-mannose-protein mannosyltransferase
MTESAPPPTVNSRLRDVSSAAHPSTILWQLAEVLLWGGLGLAVAFTMLAFRPLPLSNDSCQYLSVASNIRHGEGITTDLVYFDTERSHGRIPAPLTTFPPGYPAAVGMISSFFGGVEKAARILSALSFAGTAALLAVVLIVTRVAAWVRAFVTLLFITNAASADFSTAALTESMFVFVFTAAIVALIVAWWGFPRPRVRWTWTIAGLVLAGLSYWIRYAGLFLIAALVLYLGLRFLRLRDRLHAAELFATLLPIGLAGALMARNVLLVGTWKGGNSLSVSNPLRRVLAHFGRDQMHLLLGEHLARFGAWEAILLAGCLSLVAFVGWRILRDGPGDPNPPRAYGLWTLLFTCAAVYTAGLCYAGLRSVISFAPRMFLPVLPLYLLLFGLALHWLISRAQFRGEQIWFRVTLCALLIGYIGVNARDLKTPKPISRLDLLSGQLAERTAEGQRLSDWMNAHIDPAAVIAAQDGQITGFLLHRRTLGLVESEYSLERWECPEIRRQMNRFGARYLILYRNPDKGSLLLQESNFAAQSASGQPSCGFAIAAENPDVRILKIESTTAATGILPE